MKVKFGRNKNCKLFTDNIYDHEWIELDKTTVEKDPFHGVKVEVKWYKVAYDGEEKEFGFTNISADQDMFVYE